MTDKRLAKELFELPQGNCEVPDLAPMRRANHSVRVRPAIDADVAFLPGLFGADEIAYRWIFRGRIPTPDTVRSNLNRANIIAHVAEYTETGRPFGYVVAYDINYTNGYAYLGGVVGPDEVGTGMGITVLMLFVDYLFAVLPLRKLYMQSIEYAYRQYHNLVGRGYGEIEGVLKDHEYFGGRYWDVYVISLDREHFLKLRANTRLGQR